MRKIKGQVDCLVVEGNSGLQVTQLSLKLYWERSGRSANAGRTQRRETHAQMETCMFWQIPMPLDLILSSSNRTYCVLRMYIGSDSTNMQVHVDSIM